MSALQLVEGKEISPVFWLKNMADALSQTSKETNFPRI